MRGDDESAADAAAELWLGTPTRLVAGAYRAHKASETGAEVTRSVLGRLGIPHWAVSSGGDGIDAAVATALATVAVAALAVADVPPPGGRPPDLAAYAISLALTLPLAVRRRWPLAVFAVILGALVMFGLRRYPGLNVDFFGTALAVYTVAAHRSRHLSVSAVLLLMGAVTAVSLVTRPVDEAVANLVNVALIVTGIWIFGDGVRARREYTDRIVAQSEALRLAQAELADRAVNQERLRIARELHDVVAHHMSAVVVQAALAQDRLIPDPPAASRAIAQVEGIGRNALREMRHILGVLRQADEDQGALSPSPSFRDLESLYERVRDGGLSVEVTEEGEPTALPPAVELAAYRILQESLTNALRHAPQAHVQVRLKHAPRVLSIEVTDDGGTTPTTATSGAGQGLAGMQERVSMLRGSFEAGPHAGRGFRVAAVLPVEG